MSKSSKKDNKPQTGVSYLYDDNRNIIAVQLPYAKYLALVQHKKKELLTDDGSGQAVGHTILAAAISEHRGRGKTLAEIARHLGVSQPYLSKLLKNNTNIGTDTLNRYLNRLDTLK